MVAALAALLVDAAAGEPPARLHPVVGMGTVLRAGRHASRARRPASALLAGAALVGVGGAAVWMLAAGAERAISRLLAREAVRGAALKPALALRALLDAGAAVERALTAGDLAEARRLLAWHLVSRDTAELNAGEVAGAAIASLAENLTDSVVAPLFAFRLGGLPAAYLHRWINTADAMLGYRTAELEWFGKPAARADDVLSWIPARLAALSLAAAAPLAGLDGAGAVRTAFRDAGRTPSPNGGWTMAAAAGALGVRLEKRGVYTLNPGGREPAPADLRRARRLVAIAAAIALLAVESV